MNKTKAVQAFTNHIITSVVIIAVGVLFAIFKSDVFRILLTVIGALVFLLGVFEVVRRIRLWEGIVEMLIGAFVIVGAWLLFNVAALIAGIGMLIAAAIRLYDFIKSGKKIKVYVIDFVGILCLIIFGALLVAGYAAAILDMLLLVSGILLIVWGIVDLVLALTVLSKAKKQYAKKDGDADKIE